MITRFKLFETIQQAQKIIRSKGLELHDVMDWNELKDYIVSKKLSNYLGWLANSVEDLYRKELVVDVLIWIKTNKIDYQNRSFIDVYEEFEQSEKNKPYKEFVKRWCPSSLRKGHDLKEFVDKASGNKIVASMILSDIISYEKKKLLRLGSRYKTFTEWVDYVIQVLEPSKDNNINDYNADVILNNDQYLIFRPNDQESYIENVVSKSWCLLSKKWWNYYIERNEYFYIVRDKNDIRESIIITIKDNKVLSINDFTNSTVYNSFSKYPMKDHLKKIVDLTDLKF